MNAHRRHLGSSRAGAVCVWLAVLAVLVPRTTSAAVRFVDITLQAGFDYRHGYQGVTIPGPMLVAAGVAAGDFDRDGWVDLFVSHGDLGPNLLFRNLGDGTFVDVAATAGVDLPGTRLSGSAFADVDGDGWLDLAAVGIHGAGLTLFRNRGDGTFEDVSMLSGFRTHDSYSVAFGDYDRDGDLDLAQSHWGSDNSAVHLWRNEGQLNFVGLNRQARISGLLYEGRRDYTFTPNFVDINNDGWPDLLMTSDFNTSQVFINQQNATFLNTTNNAIITDENGMGAAIGDYDHDGDLDWFVSSIWDTTPPDTITAFAQDPRAAFVEDPRDTNILGWGRTGNRLYQNQGDGSFVDVTDEAGVREGDWGWGSVFADLDNDGNLDIFHVNGWRSTIFSVDRSRLFMSNGDGTFTERSHELGIDDTGNGRGVACFDFDRDGALDLFIANNTGPPKFYRNDGGNANRFLSIRLEGDSPNTEAIGARIYAKTGALTQMWEMRAGSNFASQDPAVAHFGLGSTATVDELRIVWPDGSSNALTNVPTNRAVTYNQEELRHLPAPNPPSGALQAWPVPARGTVSFAWPAVASAAVLQIYDIGGARVWETAVPSGQAVVEWNGLDANGRALRPGVYLARIRYAGGTMRGRFVLAP